MTELPADVTNWGRWKESSEVGALNHVGADEVVGAAGLVRQGRVFPLGLPIGAAGGDPILPERPRTLRVVYRDWGHYAAGCCEPVQEDMSSVDDGIFLSCHGTTHVDALGHIIVGGRMWDNRDASLSVGSMRWGSIEPLARRGVFTAGVLADVARARGVEHLGPTEQITFAEVQAILGAQDSRMPCGSVLLLRTGSLKRYYEIGYEEFFRDYSEPGLTYEPELIEWCLDTGISGLGTDTLANELPRSATIPADYPLHRYLLRNLGVVFHEALWLEDLAEHCAGDHVYEGLYVASPLRLVGASGSPVNPLFVK